MTTWAGIYGDHNNNVPQFASDATSTVAATGCPQNVIMHAVLPIMHAVLPVDRRQGHVCSTAVHGLMQQFDC